MTQKRIDKTAYPFAPREFSLPMGKMSYLDEGSGDPFMMTHGNPSWSFEFRDLIKALFGSFRCITPDHIGFVLSDQPGDWEYLPTQHAQNLDLERV